MASNTSLSTRALVVTLKSPVVGKTSPEVAEITGLSVRVVNKIYATAIEHGFDPNHRPFTLGDEWLEDENRSRHSSREARQARQALKILSTV
jgi:hypothetical protein